MFCFFFFFFFNPNVYQLKCNSGKKDTVCHAPVAQASITIVAYFQLFLRVMLTVSLLTEFILETQANAKVLAHAHYNFTYTKIDHESKLVIAPSENALRWRFKYEFSLRIFNFVDIVECTKPKMC